jgi:probable rRNA maturation factor
MQFPELNLSEDGLNEAPFQFYTEDVELTLPDEERLATWLHEVVAAEKANLVAVTFIFCSDEYLLNMNVEYLEHDYYTDIITFQLTEGAVHGDLFISSERVADNAQTNGVSFEQELCRVMVHGVLHLMGYGDKTPDEQAKMREKEDFYLKMRH